MENHIPSIPNNSSRVTINLDWPEKRLDNVLLEHLRTQESNAKLRSISRGVLKKLFVEGKIQIKGQNARPSSALAKGTTYIDIIGY